MKLSTKNKMVKVKTKNGYLMIFFSLVLTMAMIPIMVRTLENSIYVRSEIRAWDTWSDSMSTLKNQNYLLLKQGQKMGMGYFNHGVIKKDLTKELPADTPEGTKYEYFGDYSSASTVPVPTMYGTNLFVDKDTNTWHQDVNTRVVGAPDGNTAECHAGIFDIFPLISFWKDCNAFAVFKDTKDNIHFVAGASYKPAENEQKVKEAKPNYLYTAPMIGTGMGDTTIRGCEWTRPYTATGRGFAQYNRYIVDDSGKLLSSFDDSEGTMRYIDPLDDPCNWGKLQPGDTVAIPLFVKYNKNKDGEISDDEVYILGRNIRNEDIFPRKSPEQDVGAQLLSLRLRLSCLSLQGAFCKPEDRLVVDLPIEADGTHSVNTVLKKMREVESSDPNDFIQTDNSKRIIDWAIVDFDPEGQGVRTFRPSEVFHEHNGMTRHINESSTALTKRLGKSTYYPYRFNYEITQRRMRSDTRGLWLGLDLGATDDRGGFFIRHDIQSKISSFNFYLLKNLYLSDFRYRVGDYVQVVDSSGLARVYDPKIKDNTVDPEVDGLETPAIDLNRMLKANQDHKYDIKLGSGSDAATYTPKYPFLVIKYEDWYYEPLKSEKQIKRGNTEAQHYKAGHIEYQLVSDRPIGNDRQYVQGRIKHPTGQLFRRVEEKGVFPSSKYAPKDTGIVFSN